MDKHYLSHVLLYLLLTVFGLALIAEMGFQLYDSVSDSVETVEVNPVTYRQTLDTVGFIGRQETVLANDEEGECRCLVADGETVSQGQTVAGIYESTPGFSASLTRVRELEEQIATLESAQTLASGYTPASVEKAISELRADIATAAQKGDLTAAASAEADLRRMLAISRIVTGKTPSYKDDVATLKNELQNAISGLGDPKVTVKSTGSGRFYSQVDGYENRIDFSDLSALSAADCLRVFERNGTPAGTGTPVGKLADSFSWYLICEVAPEYKDMLAVGFEYPVLMNDQETEVTMTLSALLTDEESGRLAAIFHADRIPVGMDFTRFQSVSVTLSTSEGYEVPSGALRVVDGVTGVYVLHGSVVQFREIRARFGGDGYVFTPAEFESESGVSPLSFYDRLIVKGKGLYVGKIVD